MTNIDNELWYKIKEDDINAFEQIFNKYYGVLCAYSYRLIKDEETAKETVSDTFVKLWQKREIIDITQGLKPYLFRCVHNLSIDYLESTRISRLHPKVEISDKIKELIADDNYFLDNLIIEELENEVQNAIDKLPQQCRIIFCMSRYNLLTYNEISESLNISVNTVKTQICRALNCLRKDLQKYL